MWNSFGIGGVSCAIAVHCYGIAMVLLYDFCGIPKEFLGDCCDTTMALLWECFASKIGIAVILLRDSCGIASRMLGLLWLLDYCGRVLQRW